VSPRPRGCANPSGSGGTNLRVCLVTLQGEGKFEITQTKYRLTEEQKQEDGQKLFDFCAECLKTFVDTNLADENSGLKLKAGERLPLGFTVSSLPLSQLIDSSPSSSLTRAREYIRSP
jgi:hexokinase